MTARFLVKEGRSVINFTDFLKCFSFYVGSLKIVVQGDIDYFLVVHLLKKVGYHCFRESGILTLKQKLVCISCKCLVSLFNFSRLKTNTNLDLSHRKVVTLSLIIVL